MLAERAGETDHAKLIYLALHTRHFDRISSVLIKGPTAGGKTFLLQTVLRFVPEDSHEVFSGMSQMAIVYGESDIRHKHLVIMELAGMKSGPEGHPYLRTLLSEGYIRYQTTEGDTNRKSRTIMREGPTGLIMTTTAPSIHEEDESRMLSLTVKDTPDQIIDVLLMQAEQAETGTQTSLVDLHDWRCFSEWIALGEHGVVIPFARALAQLVAPVSTRIKRDFEQLLSLVKTHALLHQLIRDTDDKGRIIATIEDYAVVRPLVDRIISDAAEATVPVEVRETVEAVRKLTIDDDRPFLELTFDEWSRQIGVSQSHICEALGLNKATVSRRVKLAIELGYLVNLEEKKGQPAKLVLGEPMPNERQVLPTPEEVKAALQKPKRRSRRCPYLC